MIFKVGFFIGNIWGKKLEHSSIPQQVLGGHLDFDTANVVVMLLRCFLAPPPSTVVGPLLLLGRRHGLPSIFNTLPLLQLTAQRNPQDLPGLQRTLHSQQVHLRYSPTATKHTDQLVNNFKIHKTTTHAAKDLTCLSVVHWLCHGNFLSQFFRLCCNIL